jgi:hypothetical protein
MGVFLWCMKKLNMLMQQLASAALERKLLEVKEKALKKVPSDYGTFTIAHRTSYIYTEAVKKLEEATKLKKVEEEEKGLAEEKVTEYILFKEVKVK